MTLVKDFQFCKRVKAKMILCINLKKVIVKNKILWWRKKRKKKRAREKVFSKELRVNHQ